MTSMNLSSAQNIPKPVHDGLPVLTQLRNNTIIQPTKDVAHFIAYELDLSRLNVMVDHSLWLAGRIGNVQCLHRQRLIGRRIVICEQLDLHLLWKDDAIFVKPLPDWILDLDFVRNEVSKNADALAAVNGFLMSYARLINYKSDFRIAKDEHLLPDAMEWENWQSLVEERLAPLIADIVAGRVSCAARFKFGELRLSRINMIYRYHPAYRLKHLFRGFHRGNETYKSFLHRNFAWLIAVFAYITIVLAAMQVGLGTQQLRANTSFNKASFGFTAFSILLPVAALGSGFAVSLILTVYHVSATRRHLRLAKGHLIPSNKA